MHNEENQCVEKHQPAEFGFSHIFEYTPRVTWRACGITENDVPNRHGAAKNKTAAGTATTTQPACWTPCSRVECHTQDDSQCYAELEYSRSRGDFLLIELYPPRDP